jgi:hypothetical protein
VEIGVRLNISQRTVESHRAALMQRLGLQNHTELIRHAIRHGLIPADRSVTVPGIRLALLNFATGIPISGIISASFNFTMAAEHGRL